VRSIFNDEMKLSKAALSDTLSAHAADDAAVGHRSLERN
jgi:hypothetical protein